MIESLILAEIAFTAGVVTIFLSLVFTSRHKSLNYAPIVIPVKPTKRL